MNGNGTHDAPETPPRAKQQQQEMGRPHPKKRGQKKYRRPKTAIKTSTHKGGPHTTSDKARLATRDALELEKYILPPAPPPQTQEQFEVFLRDTHKYPPSPQFRFGYTFFRHFDAFFGQPRHTSESQDSFVQDARSPHTTPTHKYLPGNKKAYEWQKQDDIFQLRSMRIPRTALPPPDIKKLPMGYLYRADYLDALDSLSTFFDCQLRFSGHPFSLGYRTPQETPRKLNLNTSVTDRISFSLRHRDREIHLKSIRQVLTSRINFKTAQTMISSTLPLLHARRLEKYHAFLKNSKQVSSKLELPPPILLRRARLEVTSRVISYKLAKRNSKSTLFHLSFSLLRSPRPLGLNPHHEQILPYSKTPHSTNRQQLLLMPSF